MHQNNFTWEAWLPLGISASSNQLILMYGVIRYGKKSGWPRKKRVYVFDVFDVFACLRFSLKVDFIINVSDVFDVFDVFRYFLKKIEDRVWCV